MKYLTENERKSAGVSVFDLYKKGQKVATVAEVEGKFLTNFINENERAEFIEFQERNEYEELEFLLSDLLAYSPEYGISSVPDWEKLPV